eukprot:ctg_757.g359
MSRVMGTPRRPHHRRVWSQRAFFPLHATRVTQRLGAVRSRPPQRRVVRAAVITPVKTALTVHECRAENVSMNSVNRRHSRLGQAETTESAKRISRGEPWRTRSVRPDRGRIVGRRWLGIRDCPRSPPEIEDA